MRHRLIKIVKTEGMDQISEGGVMSVFLSAYKSEACSSNVYKLYRGFLDFKRDFTSYIKEKWKKECSLSLSEVEWESIVCIFQWKITLSGMWREFCWKNILRFSPRYKRDTTQTHLDAGECATKLPIMIIYFGNIVLYRTTGKRYST